MSRMGCVADQDHAIVFDPVVAVDRREIDPGGSPDVSRIGQQRVSIEVVLENLSTGLSTLFMRHVFEAERVINLGRRLDDESRGVVVELVSMRPDPAMIRSLEDEGKGITKRLVRA